MMEGVIVLIVFCICVWNLPKWIYRGYKKLISSGDNRVHTTNGGKKSASLPKDIYQAIELFARICSTCKRETGWEYSNDSATICVTVSNSNVRLELSCNGDCIALRLPEEYKYLYSSDNLIEYKCDDCSGYVREKYGSNVPTDADSLFYFYKKGDPHAIGKSLSVTENGNKVFMLIDLR